MSSINVIISLSSPSLKGLSWVLLLYKTDAENTRRPSLHNSPVVKRLNTKIRAKHSPLKKSTNHSKEISQFRKKNFIKTLNNWEHLSTKNLTPAVIPEPRLKKTVDSQSQEALEKNLLKSCDSRPDCDWTENLENGTNFGSQPITSSHRKFGQNVRKQEKSENLETWT